MEYPIVLPVFPLICVEASLPLSACFPPQIMEWYLPWSKLAPCLTQYMDGEDDILVCGCGNSEISVDMHDDGEKQLSRWD